MGRWRSTSFAQQSSTKIFEVHLGLATELVDVTEELTLIRADRFAKHLIVIEDGAEPEGKYRRMLKAVSNDTGVVNASLLVERFLRIVLADDDCEVACGVKKNLVSWRTPRTDSRGTGLR